MKGTLANANTTAPATSLCCLCCICNCLSYLYLYKSSLPFLGSNLYSLAASYLCPPGGTVTPVTRCPTNVLATNHPDKLLYLDKLERSDDVLTLVRLGLSPYLQAWPRIHN
jgi:hypothetical protein